MVSLCEFSLYGYCWPKQLRQNYAIKNIRLDESKSDYCGVTYVY